jgi:hypothetical protein
MLPTHTKEVIAPLRGTERELKRKPSFGADWIARLVLRDLFLGPSVNAATELRQLNALCRIGLAQPIAMACCISPRIALTQLWADDGVIRSMVCATNSGRIDAMAFLPYRSRNFSR